MKTPTVNDSEELVEFTDWDYSDVGPDDYVLLRKGYLDEVRRAARRQFGDRLKRVTHIPELDAVRLVIRKAKT